MEGALRILWEGMKSMTCKRWVLFGGLAGRYQEGGMTDSWVAQRRRRVGVGVDLDARICFSLCYMTKLIRLFVITWLSLVAIMASQGHDSGRTSLSEHTRSPLIHSPELAFSTLKPAMLSMTLVSAAALPGSECSDPPAMVVRRVVVVTAPQFGAMYDTDEVEAGNRLSEVVTTGAVVAVGVVGA